MHSRLSSALAETEAPVIEDVVAMEEKVQTTDDEKEGYMIVKAIVRDTIKSSRVHIRDQQTYCGILVDDNNRKPLARLHFNKAVKYIGLFDGEKEERVLIESLDHMYD